MIKTILQHSKCRNVDYPSTNLKISRFFVPDDKISWEIDWMDYAPPYYSCQNLSGKPWADPELNSHFQPDWNNLDGSVNRCSYHGTYKILNMYPLNPAGRTGLRGRGILGRWGPNHAADPIVTKWKRNQCNGKIYNEHSNKPILQFIGIRRKDNGEWAVPGGMVDSGEVISKTLKREFMEEALDYLSMNNEQQNLVSQKLNDFFGSGIHVYKGYVDDVRNTDNAWIETVAQNFHDEDGLTLDGLKLRAGDDAGNVKWIDISKEINLYASHSNFLRLVAEKHKAHW